MIAYYPFNENANDESGNGYDGSVYGANLAPDRFGNPESAYNFNGSNDYIQTDITASQFANDFTITAWVNFSNFDNYYPQVLCGENYFVVFHGMGPVYKNQKDHITFYQQTGVNLERGGRIGSMVSANALQTGEWHFVTVIKSGLQFSLLIDNILQAESDAEHSIQLTGSSLYIGANIPGGGQAKGYMEGLIDDIYIFNRALTRSEIQILYSEGGW